MMLLTAALLLVSPQAEPGLPDAATGVAHVADCLAATSADKVDLTKIEARGWTSMALKSSDGKAMPIAAYTRTGDMSFLSASTASAKRVSCVLLIPTHGLARAEALRDALTTNFATKPSGAVTDQATWTTGGYRIAATPMGNAANPSGLKIEVTVEKK